MQCIKKVLEKYILMEDINKNINFDNALEDLLCVHKNLKFYRLEVKKIFKNGKIKEWEGHIFLSLNEAKAFQSTISKTNSDVLDKYVDFISETNLIKLSVDDILDNDEYLRELENRIERITPYTKNDLEKLNENSKIVWFFDSYKYHFILNDDKLIIPENFNYLDGFGTYENVCDEFRYVGLYNKKLKKFELPCEYSYIKVEGSFAELSKLDCDSFDFKKNICSIYDIKEAKIIETKAIKNSLGTQYSEYLVLKNNKVAYCNKEGFITNFYDDISEFWNGIASFKKGKLWGFLDKKGKELIEPLYLDYSYFNFGYAIVRHKDSPNNKMLIDISGKTIIESKYKEIEHYKDDLFFVKDENNRYCIYKKSEQLTDFINVTENHYEELEKVLNLLLEDFKKQKYILSLQDYLDLFPTVDLHNLELFMHPVIVNEIPENYKDIVVDKNGKIGWEYPCSKSMFDFKKELPVILKKTDGTNLSLGIDFKQLTLVSKRL